VKPIPRAVIQLQALQHNLMRVKEHAPHAKVLAMIKANAYGHGLLPVAEALSQADALGVARLNEAIALRQAGIQKEIVLMGGFQRATDLPLIAQLQLSVVIHHEYQLDLLATQPLSQPIFVWLKIDTGMHRLGFPLSAAAIAWQRLSAMPHVVQPVGMMTHFANADDPAHPATATQLANFHAVTGQWPGPRNLACSGAIISIPATHSDWVRPGIMLYGISPFAEQTGVELGLRAAMTLQSELIAVQQLKKGDAVSYGGLWTCPEDMPVGAVAMGYGDGYPRHAPSGTPLLVRDRLCTLIGRVSMDLIMVDLRPCADARVGDPVTLWGEMLPVETIAKQAGTISYELVCGVAPRVTMVYE
jgi:alanine racemase